MENRNGQIAAAMVMHADGDAALLNFVRTVREFKVTPHITKNDRNRSAIWTAEPRGIAATPSA